MLMARPTLVSSTSAPDCWATCATANAIESSVRMPVMSSFLPSSSTSLPNLRTGGGIVALRGAAGRGAATLGRAMMVHLYDYAVPVADAASGVPNLRESLAGLGDEERKALLGGLFKVERMPGTMERLSTLVTDLEASFGDLLTLLDNAARVRRFVAIDEAKAVLDRYLPESAIAGTHDWDVARLHEPYGDGSYHGKLLKRVRKQLRSVSSREALVTPFLLRREWGR